MNAGVMLGHHRRRIRASWIRQIPGVYAQKIHKTHFVKNPSKNVKAQPDCEKLSGLHENSCSAFVLHRMNPWNPEIRIAPVISTTLEKSSKWTTQYRVAPVQHPIWPDNIFSQPNPSGQQLFIKCSNRPQLGKCVFSTAAAHEALEVGSLKSRFPKPSY